MLIMDEELTQEKGLRQRFKRQPVSVRMLVTLFGLLVMCDVMVMAIMLDGPDQVVRALVEIPGMAADVLANLDSESPREVVAAWAEEATRQPGGSPTSFLTLSPTETLTESEAIQPRHKSTDPALVLSATAFSPQTFTPTATALPSATPTPEPIVTEPPPPPSPPEEHIPDSAQIEGVTGYYQSLPLSCESRSAVDWARFFGVEINELEFQYALPFGDNPDLGFVGDPRSSAGGIPPYSYGVHAGPVARLLRAYGVSAMDRRWMSYDDLRREIAAGRPVIVWVVNNVIDGVGVSYTASDGLTTTVVSLEHTVMIIGYTPDVVVVQDGGGRYERPVDLFLRSWGVLENMAVTAQ